MAKEMTVTRANELLDQAVIVDAMTEQRVAVGREFVADIDRYDQREVTTTTANALKARTPKKPSVR
jgi:hypothetical protein